MTTSLNVILVHNNLSDPLDYVWSLTGQRDERAWKVRESVHSCSVPWQWAMPESFYQPDSVLLFVIICVPAFSLIQSWPEKNDVLTLSLTNQMLTDTWVFFRWANHTNQTWPAHRPLCPSSETQLINSIDYNRILLWTQSRTSGCRSFQLWYFWYSISLILFGFTFLLILVHPRNRCYWSTSSVLLVRGRQRSPIGKTSKHVGSDHKSLYSWSTHLPCTVFSPWALPFPLLSSLVRDGSVIQSAFRTPISKIARCLTRRAQRKRHP